MPIRYLCVTDLGFRIQHKMGAFERQIDHMSWVGITRNAVASGKLKWSLAETLLKNQRQ